MRSALLSTESTKVRQPRAEHAFKVRARRRLSTDSGVFELDVDFVLPAGITILFGPSGAGKTTLLDCVAGLANPNEGRIVIGDRTFFDSEKAINLPAKQRRSGYVFQDLALFPHLSVERNVAYGLSGLDVRERIPRVASTLESLAISHLRKRRTAELSGGERRRVALA